jgi:hypothetical protein
MASKVVFCLQIKTVTYGSVAKNKLNEEKIMKRKRRLVSAFCILSLLGLVLSTAGCHRPKSPEEKAEFVVDILSSKLDFSDEQEQMAMEIGKDLIDEHKQMHGEREAHKKELIDMVKADQLDQEKIVQKINEKLDRIKQRAPVYVARVAELHKTLSQEQKDKLVKLIEKKHKKGCFR